jgi:hypothetical protein
MYDNLKAGSATAGPISAPLTIRLDQISGQASKALESAHYLRDRLFGSKVDQTGGPANLAEVRQTSVENTVSDLESIIGRLCSTLEEIHGRV